MIRNPIIPGFNPDPCICRKGEDYYLAVSTFEWFPGIPIYHSKDLKNWELYTHVLTDDEQVDLKKLPSAKGIWAPWRCTLGRETAIQKMKWTGDGWLRMSNGGNLAELEVEEADLPEVPMSKPPAFDDFDGDELENFYYAPRIMPQRFADLKARPGWIRLRGQESRTSLNKVSILARKLTSVYARITTKMEFSPEVHQHSAGLILYYDNMNYIYLRKYHSDTLGQDALTVVQMENGARTVYLDDRTPVHAGPIYMRLFVEGRKCWFEWGYDGADYQRIGAVFDTTKFSDEYCKYGEFTGTMVGITCADRVLHRHYADFDFLEYVADETKPVD